MNGTPSGKPDIILIGAGIISATLAVFLKELDPSLAIEIFETLDGAALESSDAWNNAGTGHSALCELNYTPERPDGSIDTAKALPINEAFKVSKQLWAYLVDKGHIANPSDFIRRIPHMSFIHGAKNVEYLRKHHAALNSHHLFKGMEFSDDPVKIAEWIPLVMAGRDPKQPVAATFKASGSDVNFDTLTRSLINYL